MDSCDGGEADAAVCGGSGMLGRWGVGVPELAGIEGLRDETGNQRVMDIVVQLVGASICGECKCRRGSANRCPG